MSLSVLFESCTNNKAIDYTRISVLLPFCLLLQLDTLNLFSLEAFETFRHFLETT